MGYAYNPGTWDDDNGLGCGDFYTSTQPSYYNPNFPTTCTLFEYSAQATTGCANMFLDMRPKGTAGCNINAYYPLPNQYCTITFSCTSPAWSSITLTASTYAYLSGEPGHVSYTASTIPDQTLNVNQVFTLDLSTTVTFASPSTITSVTMYNFPSSNTKAITLSGNIVSYSFSTVQSSSQFYFNITTNVGYAYSNAFSITVVDCGTPTITIASYQSTFTKTGIVLTTPYSVFLASTYTTNSNPSQCTLSYQLYDSTGTSNWSGLTTPQKFNSSTGELQIESFTSGTYQQTVNIKVIATYNLNSQAFSSVWSTPFTIYYSQSTVVVCNPTIASTLSLSNLIKGVHNLNPVVAFTFQTYASTSFSTYCGLTYSLLDSSGNSLTSTAVSFSSTTGQFQIQSYTNNIFQQSIKIKVTSSYQNSSNSIISNLMSITYVYCQPSISNLGPFLLSSASIGIPVTIFSASTSSSIQNPTYCQISSYGLLDSANIDVSSLQVPQKFSSSTGQFQITRFTNGQFVNNFYVKVYAQCIQDTSTTVSATSSIININYIDITEVNCTPVISLNGDILGSISSLQTPYTVFNASTYFSTQSPCVLSYQLYAYPSGNEVTNINSPFQFIQSSGQFQITSYSNNMFEFKLTIQVTSSFQQSVNAQSTIPFTIRIVYCVPSYFGQNNYKQSVKQLYLPFNVFTASQFTATSSSLCQLKFTVAQFFDILGNDQTNKPNQYNFILDSQSGQFIITNFPMYQFKTEKLQIQIGSYYGSSQAYNISVDFKVDIFSCTPIINNYFLKDKIFHKDSDGSQSIKNPKILFVNSPYRLSYTPNINKECILSFEAYYENGTLCNYTNSQVVIKGGIFLLTLTKTDSFIQKYYFKTYSSYNLKENSYSNSLNSENFTIELNVKFNLGALKQSQLGSQNLELNFDGFNAKIKYRYIKNTDCDINSAKIITRNTNFIKQIQKGTKTIQLNFENFTTSDPFKCIIYHHELFTSDTGLALPKEFGPLQIDINGKQSIDVDVSKVETNQTFKFQIYAVAIWFKCLLLYCTEPYQEIIIDAQLQVSLECQFDQIYQNNKLAIYSQKDIGFIIKDKMPVMYLNITNNEINVDIASRFQNFLNQTCPLSYYIYKIKQNNQTLNLSNQNEILELDSQKGIFKLKKQVIYTFDHYQIYFQAINQANVSLITSSYLIDASVYNVKYSLLKKKQNQQKFSRQQACSAFISSIDSNGNVIIIFNDIMNTNLNFSHINSSNTYVYIKPGNNRQFDEDFDPSTLDFTWAVQSFDKETMKIKLLFFQPLEISPLIQQDLLVINFNQTKDLLYCVNKKTNLYDQYSTIYRRIRKQSISQDNSSALVAALSLFTSAPLWLLVGGILVVIIGYGNIEYLVVFIRSLQFIILLPGLNVSMPANICNYIQIIQKISSYDVLTFFNIYALPGLRNFKFDQDAENPLQHQLQDVGYDNRNALIGLSTLAFLILLYFVKVLIALIVKLFQWILSGKYYTQQFYQIISKDLFYNQILSLAIEGFIDFCMFGYLNIVTREFSLDGEIVGFAIGTFSLSISSLILPIVILTLLITKSAKQIQDKIFEESWGSIFKMIKVENISSRIYYLVFYQRRIIYLSICLLVKEDQRAISVITVSQINVLYSLYIGSSKPFQNNRLNKQEMFNEFFVILCTLFLMILSDWVKLQIQKYFHGFVMIIFLLFYVFSNVFLVLYIFCFKVYLVILKSINLANHYLNYMQNKAKNKSELKIKSINSKAFEIQDPQFQKLRQQRQQEKQIKERQQIIDKILVFQRDKLQQTQNQKDVNVKKVKFGMNNSINKVNSVSQSSYDEDSKSINYLLYLNQIPLETTEKLQQPHAFPIKSIDNFPSNIKEDKVYIQYLNLYNNYKYLFECNPLQVKMKEYYQNDFVKDVEQFALNSSDNRDTLNFKCIDIVGVAKQNVDIIRIQGIQNPEEKIRQFTEELYVLVKSNFIFQPKIKKSNFMKILD